MGSEVARWNCRAVELPKLVQFCLKNINSKISRRGVTLIIYAKVISRFAAVARRAGARYERLRGQAVPAAIRVGYFVQTKKYPSHPELVQFYLEK